MTAPAPAVVSTGPASAPLVVLLHGSVLSHVMWTPQLEALAGDCRVVAPDLPGHGARRAERFSLDAAAAVIDACLDAEGGRPAVLVGLSLGGYVALDYAGRRPDRVAALVLAGCSRNLRGLFGVYLRAVSSLMRRGWLRQRPEVVEARTRRLFPGALAAVAEAQVRAGLAPGAVADAFGELAGRDFLALASGFAGPIVLANGERDAFYRRGEAAFLARCRAARSRPIAGAGHACSLDDPGAFTAVILDGVRTCVTIPRAGPRAGPTSPTLERS